MQLSRSVCVVLLSFSLFACSIVSRSSHVQTKFVLTKESCQTHLDASKPAIILANVRGTQSLSGTSIVFSKSGNTRAPYKYSSWAQPFSEQFLELLTRELECSGAFSSVTHLSPGTKADLLLNTEIVELVHDAASTPSKVQLSIRSELIHLPTRKIALSHLSQIEVPLEEVTAAGAVRAFDAAVKRAVVEQRGLTSAELLGTGVQIEESAH